ncbi:ABC transporter permease [Kitasatospora sp. CM 4170]|uniref:Transport permease protein n=1 Tax=Kitasatospora aburaviensis TaxID=67265 RepID=A0ABW1EV63_9ACTN|nr:ABC transporter permease [Kitasatospora sp. CM 4170]WNM44789.1 ABC transporter permease [Kitasatospora sp. CM 4170]
MKSYILGDSIALFGRHMTHLRRTPQKILHVTLMPIMFVILFGYLFGSSMSVPDGDYHEYIMAGIFIQIMLASVVTTGVGVAEDLKNGLVDRFRSMPMAQVSVLLGRTFADVLLNATSCIAMASVGLLIGWRTHTNVFKLLEGFLLIFLLGFVMTWLGSLIGLIVREPQGVNAVAMFVTMPSSFLSATFYPLDNLPGWLQTIAQWNPMTTMATALRELWGNPTANGTDLAFPLRYPVASSLIMLSLLLVVLIPLTTRAYDRAARKG